MTFAAVGSPFTWDTTPITFTPHGVGNLIVLGSLTKLAASATCCAARKRSRSRGTL
jgi:hypothetical protein